MRLLSSQLAKNIRDLSARRLDIGKDPLIRWLGVAGAGEDSDDNALRVTPRPHDDHSARVGCHTDTLTGRRAAGVNISLALTQR